MALNKLKGFFTGEETEVETTGEDSFYNVSKEEYPEIAKEWHPQKNIDVSPEGVLPYSRKKV